MDNTELEIEKVLEALIALKSSFKEGEYFDYEGAHLKADEYLIQLITLLSKDRGGLEGKMALAIKAFEELPKCYA
jgi:hypothetical protein